MKEVFLKSQSIFKTIGIIAGICFALLMIIKRVHFAFGYPLKQYGELWVIPFDLFIAMPAWLGLTKYFRQELQQNWLVPFSYFIYAIVLIGSGIILNSVNNALGNGLWLIYVVLPVTLCVTLFLYSYRLSNKKNKI